MSRTLHILYYLFFRYPKKEFSTLIGINFGGMKGKKYLSEKLKAEAERTRAS